MFGRILGNEKKLEQQLTQEGGIVAWATITDVGVDFETGHVDGFNQVTSQTDHVKVTVTVQPDTGEPFEASFRQAFTGRRPFKGWQCKVIYDKTTGRESPCWRTRSRRQGSITRRPSARRRCGARRWRQLPAAIWRNTWNRSRHVPKAASWAAWRSSTAE